MSSNITHNNWRELSLDLFLPSSSIFRCLNSFCCNIETSQNILIFLAILSAASQESTFSIFSSNNKYTKEQTKWLTSRNIVLIIHHFLHGRELMTLLVTCTIYWINIDVQVINHSMTWGWMKAELKEESKKIQTQTE
jgi:hypothetical protein